MKNNRILFNQQYWNRFERGKLFDFWRFRYSQYAKDLDGVGFFDPSYFYTNMLARNNQNIKSSLEQTINEFKKRVAFLSTKGGDKRIELLKIVESSSMEFFLTRFFLNSIDDEIQLFYNNTTKIVDAYELTFKNTLSYLINFDRALEKNITFLDFDPLMMDVDFKKDNKSFIPDDIKSRVNKMVENELRVGIIRSENGLSFSEKDVEQADVNTKKTIDIENIATIDDYIKLYGDSVKSEHGPYDVTLKEILDEANLPESVSKIHHAILSDEIISILEKTKGLKSNNLFGIIINNIKESLLNKNSNIVRLDLLSTDISVNPILSASDYIGDKEESFICVDGLLLEIYNLTPLKEFKVNGNSVVYMIEKNSMEARSLKNEDTLVKETISLGEDEYDDKNRKNYVVYRKADALNLCKKNEIISSIKNNADIVVEAIKTNPKTIIEKLNKIINFTAKILGATKKIKLEPPNTISERHVRNDSLNEGEMQTSKLKL